MTTALVLTSSALAENSVSNLLVEEVVGHLRSQAPAATFIVRDLESNPVPHLSADMVAALGKGETATAEQAAARALSDELLGELVRADTLVIGAPMYNFSIASTLKAWFDHILRAGETFRYSESGPEGLLKGKRAVIVVTRGGVYSEGEGQSMDFQEPYLRALLGFVGITEIVVVRAEKLGFGPEARAQAIDEARAELTRVLAVDAWQRAA